MYKKLQRRVFLGSTLALLLVIATVVFTMYVLSSGTVSSQSQVLLDLIMENGGVLPDSGSFNSQQELRLALNDEFLYEARYFSVLFRDGEPHVFSFRIARVSEETAIRLAEEVRDGDKDQGQVNLPGRNRLQFSRKINEDGSVLIVFMDNTSRQDLTRLLITYMAGLWLLVLILYAFVMRHFSARILRSFVQNDEQQKRFITNASHELKTPLAVISANNEMTELTVGKSKWTESTGRQIERLQALIESLVVLTRLDEMKDVNLTTVDLSAIAGEACEGFCSVAQAAGKEFSCEIEPGVKVAGEERTLRNLLSILMDNAVKYCDESGEITLSLKEKKHGKGAAFCIANSYANGEGMDFSRLFERFYRQDESHNSDKPGFGIGLSMAKEITERMKGKISVAYNNGEIRFTVELNGA